MAATFPDEATKISPSCELPPILPSLTGLRFFAAALVVAYHMSNNLGAVPVISDLARFGRTGVTFFFVLSGFVLAWTYMGKDTPLRVFYWRRFARIWPLHIVTTLFSMAVYIWTGHKIANELTPENLWPAFLLIHSWFPQPAVYRGGSGASWSLSDEMFFYAIFPVLLTLLVSVRPWSRLLLIPMVMASLSVLLWLAVPMEGVWLFRRIVFQDYFPASRVVQFISGVALAIAIRNGWRCRVPVWAAGTVVLAYHAALIPWSNAVERTDKWYPYSASQLFSLLPFALLIVSIATQDLNRGRTLLAQPTFVLLGQASFAWYLLHSPGILMYEHVFGTPGSLVELVVAWVVVAVLTQLFSIAVFLRFERPLERWLRGMVPLPRPTRAIAT